MMLLALDTATQFASVALYDGQMVLAELNWRSERRHTVELAPQVRALLQLENLQPRDVKALAVTLGPGSYTGVRIALSFAKGVVAASGLPLIAVPTLDVLAYPHLQNETPLCVLVAAGRGRYCWATYAPHIMPPRRTSEWGLQRLPDILSQISPPMRFVGELSPADHQALADAWPQRAEILAPGLAVRRGGALAELAWQRWLKGDVDEPAALSPIYLS